MFTGAQEWSLGVFRRLLKQHLASRERGGESTQSRDDKPSSSNLKSSGGSSKPQGGGQNTRGHSSAQGLSSNSHQRRTGKYCVFCDVKEHYSDQCKKYSDLKSRSAKAKSRGLCFLCLLSGHIKPKCDQKIWPCYHCQSKEHNRALCPEKVGKQLQESTNCVGSSVKADSSLSPVPRHKDVRMRIDNWIVLTSEPF